MLDLLQNVGHLVKVGHVKRAKFLLTALTILVRQLDDGNVFRLVALMRGSTAKQVRYGARVDSGYSKPYIAKG